MRTRSLAHLVSGAFVFLAAVTSGCADPGWSLSGTVVDANGAAVQGATVTLVCGEFRTELRNKTDTQGRFSISRLGHGFEERCVVEAKRDELMISTAKPTCSKPSKKAGHCADGEVRIALR